MNSVTAQPGTVEVTTHFLRSVTEGRVNVEAGDLSQGRTHQLWRVDITDESGG